MPRVVPETPSPANLPTDTIIVHREESAIWHVQCSRFAVHVAGPWEETFERWAAGLLAHRAEVEAVWPRMGAGWLDAWLKRAAPHGLPIVAGVVSDWKFIADEDYIIATARRGRAEFERTVAAGFIPQGTPFPAL